MKSAIKRGEGRRSRSSELGTKGKRLRRGHLCPPPLHLPLQEHQLKSRRSWSRRRSAILKDNNSYDNRRVCLLLPWDVPAAGGCGGGAGQRRMEEPKDSKQRKQLFGQSTTPPWFTPEGEEHAVSAARPSLTFRPMISLISG